MRVEAKVAVGSVEPAKRAWRRKLLRALRVLKVLRVLKLSRRG